MKKKMIKCPHCGEEIELDELFISQFANKFKEEAEKASLLKVREKEKLITDLKRQLTTALRKAEQVPIQRQGEAQEIEILTTLGNLYPSDIITQTRKGQNGADILQRVRLNDGTEIGTIYIESKRTESWSGGWVEKLKSDNLKMHADILIIVSQALPKEINRYGLYDNVWVTSFDFYKELTLVLRYALMKLHSLAATNQGRELKQTQLFNYFTSVEFKNTFESLLAGFQNLKQSHESEKIRTMRMWKEREGDFHKILANSISLHSSLRSIAGPAIPTIKMLESPEGN